MKIEQYIKKYKLNKSKFARLCGLNVYTIYRFIKGNGIPSSSVALKIYYATNGEVTMEDLIPTDKRKCKRPIQEQRPELMETLEIPQIFRPYEPPKINIDDQSHI
jgi:transcriptional regulator with XRE-family HTH domain